MGRAWDVGLHSPRGPGVPPGTGRPARSDLLLWYAGINNNNCMNFMVWRGDAAEAPDQRDVEGLGGQFWYEARLGGGL